MVLQHRYAERDLGPQRCYCGVCWNYFVRSVMADLLATGRALVARGGVATATVPASVARAA